MAIKSMSFLTKQKSSRMLRMRSLLWIFLIGLAFIYFSRSGAESEWKIPFLSKAMQRRRWSELQGTSPSSIWRIGKFNFVNYHWLVWYHCSTDAMMHSSLASLRRWTEANRAASHLWTSRTCFRSSRGWSIRCRRLNLRPFAGRDAPVSETWRVDSETRPEARNSNDFSICR